MVSGEITMTTFQQHLIDLHACNEAKTWAKNLTATQAWETCERPDWLLWWSARDGISKEVIVSIACEIARLVVHTPKALEAIEAAEKWVKDPTEANRVLCRFAAAIAYAAAAHVAAHAAYAATDAAAATAAATDAYAAAAYAAATAAAAATAYDDAANAAAAAAYAAATAAATAYDDAATDAYAATAAANAKTEMKAKCCSIIRAKISQPWKEESL